MLRLPTKSPKRSYSLSLKPKKVTIQQILSKSRHNKSHLIQNYVNNALTNRIKQKHQNKKLSKIQNESLIQSSKLNYSLILQKKLDETSKKIEKRLINPINKSFKYCVANLSEQGLRASLFSHNFLLEPCRITTFKLENRPFTAAIDQQIQRNIYRRKLSQTNTFRQSKAIRRKNITQQRKIKQQLIEPWQINQNQ